MCGACVRACQFNALAAVGSRIWSSLISATTGGCLIACKPRGDL
jgi:MinD superfamily P-loop ATPase